MDAAVNPARAGSAAPISMRAYVTAWSSARSAACAERDRSGATAVVSPARPSPSAASRRTSGSGDRRASTRAGTASRSRQTLTACSAARRTVGASSARRVRMAARASALSMRASVQTRFNRAVVLTGRVRVKTGREDRSLASRSTARRCTAGRRSPSRPINCSVLVDAHAIAVPRGSVTRGAALRRTR